MVESLIVLLIYVAVLCLVVYLVFWILAALGISLPAQVVKIIWIIVALVVLLMMLRAIVPGGALRIL